VTGPDARGSISWFVPLHTASLVACPRASAAAFFPLTQGACVSVQAQSLRLEGGGIFGKKPPRGIYSSDWPCGAWIYLVVRTPAHFQLLACPRASAAAFFPLTQGACVYVQAQSLKGGHFR